MRRSRRNASDVSAAAGFNPADFYAGPMDQLQVDPATGQKADGFVWGVPRDVSTFALYLNLDLIDAAGAEDPRELAKNGEWTWDKFAEVSQKIADNVEGAKGFGAGGWWANWGYFVNSGGGSFFNADRTACALDTPEAIKGLEFYQSLYASGSGVPFGEDAEPPFKAGTLGMFINGRWATPGAREIKNFNWDVAPLPTGAAPGKNWLFWGAYVVNAKTKDPAAAWKLVETLTSTEVADGSTINNAQVANVFGCKGGNISPSLSWSGALAVFVGSAIFSAAFALLGGQAGPVGTLILAEHAIARPVLGG